MKPEELGLAPLRIRGKVGKIEEHDKSEWVGKWIAEVSFWNIVGTEQVGEAMCFGPFEGEKTAHECLMEVVKTAG